jgi:acetylornithine deacetylase
MQMQEQRSAYNYQDIDLLKQDAIKLLCRLIEIPSFSGEENHTASAIEQFLAERGIIADRHLNNIWARNLFFDKSKPTLLLNSHHDTVKPNPGYTKNPFSAIAENEKLYGLGSNDAGGALVSLTSAFLYFYAQADLKYNLVLAASAEEEISGKNGVESLIPFLGKIDCAIVGEPTKMDLAVAERGLLVLDATAYGKAGHAARNEGENALYKAMKDIEWLSSYTFPKISPLLGPVKMTVTSIETANKAHNVVPDLCRFIIDVRVNELYDFEEVIGEIRKNISSEIKPRSLRMKSSRINSSHPLVEAALTHGGKIYGSPTSSDKALMPFPALKMGPGDSARSHTADEYIHVKEIEEGVSIYISILKNLLS